MENFGAIGTEQRNPRSINIDTLATDEVLHIINDEDRQVIDQVNHVIPIIKDIVDDLSPKIQRGGRLFYLGAGTSGRLGVLDASEIVPTYSSPEGQFVGIIAGGDVALRKAQEFSEDRESGAIDDLKPYDLRADLDTIIGIASSGRTPYVMGALKYGKSIGCTTIGLACVDNSPMTTYADFMISCVTGPEIVTGSTRMKAGTATKLILNMISTSVMINIGKTYGNLMVDLMPSNIKLQDRTRRIFKTIVGGYDDDTIDTLIKQCGSLKTAIMVGKTGLTIDEAKSILDSNDGDLRSSLSSIEKVLDSDVSLDNDSNVSSPPLMVPDFSHKNIVIDIIHDNIEMIIYDKHIMNVITGNIKRDNLKQLMNELIIEIFPSFDGQSLVVNSIKIGIDVKNDGIVNTIKDSFHGKQFTYILGTPKYCEIIKSLR